MRVNCMKLRAMNIGGLVEIILPNGKCILVDPWFTALEDGTDYPFTSGKTREDIRHVDYILLTHSHGDHDSDVGYFVKKFNCNVFCNVMTASELMKWHEIPYDNIFPLYSGESFTNEDFSLIGWQGKHNPNNGRTYQMGGPRHYMVGHEELDHLGSMHEFDYMITTKENFRILIAGGRPIKEEIFDYCKKYGPNVLLRQSGVRETNAEGKQEQISAEKLAQLYARYHAQIIIPFHHDVLVKSWGQEKTDSYFAQVCEAVNQQSPGSAFLYPKTWEWYTFSLSAEVSPC